VTRRCCVTRNAACITSRIAAYKDGLSPWFADLPTLSCTACGCLFLTSCLTPASPHCLFLCHTPSPLPFLCTAPPHLPPASPATASHHALSRTHAALRLFHLTPSHCLGLFSYPRTLTHTFHTHTSHPFTRTSHTTLDTTHHHTTPHLTPAPAHLHHTCTTPHTPHTSHAPPTAHCYTHLPAHTPHTSALTSHHLTSASPRTCLSHACIPPAHHLHTACTSAHHLPASYAHTACLPHRIAPNAAPADATLLRSVLAPQPAASSAASSRTRLPPRIFHIAPASHTLAARRAARCAAPHAYRALAHSYAGSASSFLHTRTYLLCTSLNTIARTSPNTPHAAHRLTPFTLPSHIRTHPTLTHTSHFLHTAHTSPAYLTPHTRLLPYTPGSVGLTSHTHTPPHLTHCHTTHLPPHTPATTPLHTHTHHTSSLPHTSSVPCTTHTTPHTAHFTTPPPHCLHLSPHTLTPHTSHTPHFFHLTHLYSICHHTQHSAFLLPAYPSLEFYPCPPPHPPSPLPHHTLPSPPYRGLDHRFCTPPYTPCPHLTHTYTSTPTHTHTPPHCCTLHRCAHHAHLPHCCTRLPASAHAPLRRLFAAPATRAAPHCAAHALPACLPLFTPHRATHCRCPLAALCLIASPHRTPLATSPALWHYHLVRLHATHGLFAHSRASRRHLLASRCMRACAPLALHRSPLSSRAPTLHTCLTSATSHLLPAHYHLTSALFHLHLTHTHTLPPCHLPLALCTSHSHTCTHTLHTSPACLLHSCLPSHLLPLTTLWVASLHCTPLPHLPLCLHVYS